jgi:hypothetical protein
LVSALKNYHYQAKTQEGYPALEIDGLLLIQLAPAIANQNKANNVQITEQQNTTSTEIDLSESMSAEQTTIDLSEHQENMLAVLRTLQETQAQIPKQDAEIGELLRGLERAISTIGPIERRYGMGQGL